MRDTIADLYYGSITPCHKRIRPGTPLRKLLDEAEQYEEQLNFALDETTKALFHRLENTENRISGTIALENFVLGFRLGMRLTVEGLLGDDDGCLGNTTEEV